MYQIQQIHIIKYYKVAIVVRRSLNNSFLIIEGPQVHRTLGYKYNFILQFFFFVIICEWKWLLLSRSIFLVFQVLQ